MAVKSGSMNYICIDTDTDVQSHNGITNQAA